jgi:hypothetical protein
MLLLKYPNFATQVKGVDQFVQVKLDEYNGSHNYYNLAANILLFKHTHFSKKKARTLILVPEKLFLVCSRHFGRFHLHNIA